MIQVCIADSGRIAKDFTGNLHFTSGWKSIVHPDPSGFCGEQNGFRFEAAGDTLANRKVRLQEADVCITTDPTGLYVELKFRLPRVGDVDLFLCTKPERRIPGLQVLVDAIASWPTKRKGILDQNRNWFRTH